VSEPPPLPTPLPPPPPAAPVSEEGRLAPLDVLRGVAVLGILYMNIQNFSMIDAAYTNPTAYGDLRGPNFAVWLVGALFFYGKFIATFSMLFGAGIVLLSERLAATGRPAARVHFRRNIALLLIGFAHAHLLWSGDILYHYALSGMLLYPFRRLPVPLLAVLAVAFLVIQITMEYRSVKLWPAAERDRAPVFRYAFNPPPELVAWEFRHIRGSWRDAQTVRGFDAGVQERGFFRGGVFFWCGGLMLLGMALYKSGFFSALAPPPVYLACVAFALFAALPATAWEIWKNFSLGWDSPQVEDFHNIVTEIASVPMALGIAGLVMLWCRVRAFAGRAAPCTSRAIFGLSLYDRLAATGRMALTNYLTQTILCTTLFYGHGLGLYGYVERTGQLCIVLGIWLLQLTWSPLWLRYFRFGPVEWLWRSATYLRLQPILR
jgi:uncharacterized protein